MQALCNEGCGKLFDPTGVKIKVRNVKKGIDKHFFECPHCKQEYITHYMDEEMKHIQARISMLRKNAPLNIKQINTFNRLMKEMQLRNNRIKEEVEGK